MCCVNTLPGIARLAPGLGPDGCRGAPAGSATSSALPRFRGGRSPIGLPSPLGRLYGIAGQQKSLGVDHECLMPHRRTCSAPRSPDCALARPAAIGPARRCGNAWAISGRIASHE